MMTSKERAEFRAQANTLDVTLIVGKGGISDTLLDEAVVLLDSHELVKGRVLETSGLTAREASDAICEALGAEGIACVGTKFVIWRKSEKVEQEKKKAASKKPARVWRMSAAHRPACTSTKIILSQKLSTQTPAKCFRKERKVNWCSPRLRSRLSRCCATGHAISAFFGTRSVLAVGHISRCANPWAAATIC